MSASAGGQFEELTSCMAPAQRRCDRARRAGRLIKFVVPAIGVGLQNACEGSKMPDGMFMPPIPRGVINRRRRPTTAKRTIVADIGPDMPGDRFAFGQDRHPLPRLCRRMVAAQSP